MGIPIRSLVDRQRTSLTSVAANDHLGVQFGVGDTVHVPPTGGFPGGPVTVDWANKRHFTGSLPGGQRVGKTSRGLTQGAALGQIDRPWQVDSST